MTTANLYCVNILGLYFILTLMCQIHECPPPPFPFPADTQAVDIFGFFIFFGQISCSECPVYMVKCSSLSGLSRFFTFWQKPYLWKPEKRFMKYPGSQVLFQVLGAWFDFNLKVTLVSKILYFEDVANLE